MKEEKEAFIESLYLQYAGKLERASLNYVRHRGEYRDLVDDSIQKTFLKAYEEYDALKDAPYIEAMAVQGLPVSADDGAEHLPKTAETACAAGGRRGADGAGADDGHRRAARQNRQPGNA